MPQLSKSSATILTWLYGAQLAEQRPVVWAELAFLLPEMSESGRRSLIFQLRKKKLVTIDVVAQQKLITITSYGIAEIQAHFPALSDDLEGWNGEWLLVIFLQSPSTDPQFRFLRQFLLDHHIGQLSRGVYLCPRRLPLAVSHQLSFYPGAVSVVKASEWQLGDERSVIGSIFLLPDLCNSLSGVSKEIQELLAIKMLEKELMSQTSKAFYVAFDRLLSVMAFDAGIHQRYFPQVVTSRSLLISLQQLFVL